MNDSPNVKHSTSMVLRSFTLFVPQAIGHVYESYGRAHVDRCLGLVHGGKLFSFSHQLGCSVGQTFSDGIDSCQNTYS
jgi:hypothetical protein